MGELEELRASAEMGVRARRAAARLAVENNDLRAQLAAAEKRATEAEVLLLVYRGTLRFASGAIEHNTKWCAENSELHKHCLEAQALINTALLSHNPHAQAVAEVLEKAQAWADGCDEPEDTEALRAAIAALNKEPQ